MYEKKNTSTILIFKIKFFIAEVLIREKKYL